MVHVLVGALLKKVSELTVSIIGLVVAFALLAVNSGFAWTLLFHPDAASMVWLRQISDFLTSLFCIVLLTGKWWLSWLKRPARPLIAAEAERDSVIRRRRDAKRWNESLKLLATFLNAIGASSFLALFVVPMINDRDQFGSAALYGLVIAFACHILGQIVLRLWKTEE